MSRFGFFATMALVLAAIPALAHEPDESEHVQGAAFGEPGDVNAPARIVEISMREGDGKMMFAPDVVTVAKGEQVRFHIKNEGDLDHEFVLGTAEGIKEHAEMMKSMPDMQHDDPNAKRLGPKTSGDIVWKFTNEGEFDFACLIPGHIDVGMKGKIVVK
jgi:uncharacterized cupredoxin-like copper-binding protein